MDRKVAFFLWMKKGLARVDVTDVTVIPANTRDYGGFKLLNV